MSRTDQYEAFLSEPQARQVALQTIAAADSGSAQYLTNVVELAFTRLFEIQGGEEKLRKMLRRVHDKALVPVDRTRTRTVSDQDRDRPF